ncbi:MAG: PrgI family protein, partial [bacterium]|nr:PrgI family protein [bacterium]
MPPQFTVPQFIDSEDKILGPITVRQFLILMTAGLISTLFYRFFDLSLFLLLSLPLIAVAGLLAFMKINGVPAHFFILNLIQTFRRAQLRIWDKTPTDQQLIERMRPEEVVKEIVIPHKPPVSSSHLQDLSLIVNTGGVFN